MSDFHLQQLAAASASVPGEVPGAAAPTEEQQPLAPAAVPPQIEVTVETLLPVVPPLEPTPTPGHVHFTVPLTLQQGTDVSIIHPPHPCHAPPLHHQLASHHDHLGIPGHVQEEQLPQGPHEASQPQQQVTGIILEPLDLEGKYQAKCAECNALRQDLNMKIAEIRKLKQELYKKSKAAKDSDAAALTSLQGENITIDVDIGPSSSRTRSYDQRWKSRFQDLVKYKLTHGDCVVPKSYKDKGLHSWVRKQRILKKDFDLGLASDESMTQERVNALNSVGFAWVVGHQSNDTQWESNFQQLVIFKSQYGHTRVPQSYDKTLHKWVLNQRCRRRLLEDKGEGKAKGMTWTRIEKLDAIDFSWSGKK
jgi:Helicase associated domain